MKTYIATAAEVKKLTADILQAANTTIEGRQTYLKLLVGTVQDELHVTAPKHAPRGRRQKLSAPEVREHLTALETVHARFYEAVLDAAQETPLPEAGLGRYGRDARAVELNRRTNFARSAATRLRAYIRAGADVRTLVPAQVTPRIIAVERPRRPPSGARLKRVIAARSTALVASVLELVETDRAAAREELELLLGQLAHQLAEIGGPAVRDARRATETRVPLRTPGGGFFVPVTETQIVRAQARPS